MTSALDGEELGRADDTELEPCKVLDKGAGFLSSWKLAIPVPLINLILLFQGRLFFHTGRNECPVSIYRGTPFICLSLTMCFLLCFPLLIISAFGSTFFFFLSIQIEARCSSSSYLCINKVCMAKACVPMQSFDHPHCLIVGMPPPPVFRTMIRHGS